MKKCIRFLLVFSLVLSFFGTCQVVYGTDLDTELIQNGSANNKGYWSFDDSSRWANSYPPSFSYKASPDGGNVFEIFVPYGGADITQDAEQGIVLDDNLIEDIDDGKITVVAKAYMYNSNLSRCDSNISIRFYNESGEQISIKTVKFPESNQGEWKEFSINTFIPQGTRKIGFYLWARVKSNYNWVAFDGMSMKLVAPAVPEIGDIADASIWEGDPFNAGFTLADKNDPVDSISLSATSSNQDLVPDGNIVLGGSGENRTITATPADDAFGNTEITIVADDGTFTTNRKFMLTVNNVNDKPVIDSVENITIYEDDGTQVVTLSGIGPGPDEQQDITITTASSNEALIPAPTVRYTSPTSTGQLTFTPEMWKTGMSKITITVEDDGGTEHGGVNREEISFLVTVIDNDEDASLYGLELSQGILTPKFDKDRQNYTVTLDANENPIQVKPSVLNPDVKIRVQGELVNSGDYSNDILLEPGENTVTITVDAENMINTKEYNITAYFDVDTALDIVALTPSNHEEDVEVDDDIEILFNEKVIPDAGHILIKRASDNSVFESFTANDFTRVRVTGNNTVVIDPNSYFESDTTYYVEIEGNSFKDIGGNYFKGINNNNAWRFTTRESRLVDLKGITIDKGFLTPSFDPEITQYSVTLPCNEGKEFSISAVKEDARAQIKINEEEKASGEAKTVDLESGDNEIQIVITAEDGTTKVYTINVTSSDYDGGSGTQDDPYIIACAESFNNIRYATDKYFIQVADIDLDAYNWSPITRFDGVYNGQGFEIQNFTMNTSLDKSGAFIDNYGTIENIFFTNVNVRTGDYYGTACEHNYGLVSNISVDGYIKTIQGGAAGIVGVNEGTISRCCNFAAIEATYAGIGGICYGNDIGGVLRDLYNKGDLTANCEIGGIVCKHNGAELANTYNSGKITARIVSGGYERTAAGIVYKNAKTVSNSYNAGEISSGGCQIVGSDYPGTVVESSQITLDQIKRQATFVGWDFDTIWRIDEGVSAPEFAWMGPRIILANNTNVDENMPAGTIVGTLLLDDPDPGEVYTYALTSGSGGKDNGSFTIENGVLKTAESFDYEVQNLYSIRVSAQDSASNIVAGNVILIHVNYISEVPDMEVTGKGVAISNGDDTPSSEDDTDFGIVTVGSGTIEKTYTILNTGASPLSLTGDSYVAIIGTNASDFSVVSQPDENIEGGSESTFTIAFTPKAMGERESQVAILSNDENKSPYKFSIKGIYIGLIVEETDGGTTVDESGTQDSFILRLSNAPSSDVVLDIESSDPGEAVTDISSMTFTPANWNTSQTVTVTGVDDDLEDGSQQSTITIRVNDGQSDDAYDGVEDQSITVTTTDDDVAYVPVTGITGVPVAVTAGTPLTLTGTVTPANATNQTIVWNVQNAGTTGATVSGNTLSITAAGTVIVRGTITNGLTASSDYTEDFTITVNPAPVTDATLAPDTGSFDRNPTNQADVTTTVTWGDATGIIDVKAGGVSIGTDNYSVSGDTLIIRKGYLAAQAVGSLPLTIEFDAGAAATLTISITDTTPPIISPVSRIYDLNAPAGVTTGITWNSASSITNVVYSVSPDTTLYTLDTGDYTVSDDTLTIKSSFLSGLSLTTGAALEFDITFNTGVTATLTVNVVNGYTPSDNAELSSLSVNGTPVAGFDPDDTDYAVELPNGTSGTTVTATASDSNAQVDITQATSLPGSATVTVTAEDGSTTRTYTINLTIAAPAFVPVTGITGVPVAATAGTPLTLTGTVTPANATNQTIVWNVQNAGMTGATVSGNTLSITAAGTVIVRGTITNGLTASSDYTEDFTITVNPAPVTDATLAPDTGSFDRNPTNQADVTTTVTWGDATGIIDVKAGGVSIGADNYSVSGDTLIIRKGYLAAQATGSLPLTIEFDAGAAATLTISITDTTPPIISPVSRIYDLNAPAGVTTGITWNSASSITNVVYSVSPDTTLYTLDTGDYTVSDDTLTIKSSFLSGLSLTTGAALEFDITFNTGVTATLTVNVVNGYTPSDNAELSSLSVNGTPVAGFDPDDTDYAVELPNGTSGTTVTATASDSNAQVDITQATSLPGSATVTVTAEDGSTTRTYTINLTIAAPGTTYTVAFNSNGEVYTTKTVNAGESIGSAAWPADPTRGNYTFGGWFTEENGTGIQFTSSTPVNTAITVYAKWIYSGGESSSGNGSTPPATSNYDAEVNAGNGSNVKLQVTVDKSSGNASMEVGNGSNILSGGKTTVITVPSVPDIETYTLGIPVPNLSTQDEQGTLAFKTATGTVTVPSHMLTGVSGISGSKAEITIGQGDKDSLLSDVKTAIGDKPLISLSLSVNGKQIEWSNPGTPVVVSIPYTPSAMELANPEGIVIWYIDGSGNAVCIPNGYYDPTTGTVTFKTTHFSFYAVGYDKVSFTDVADTAWYSDAVSFIAARGITSGTGNGKYSPDAKLTRGEFMVLIMKAYGISPDTSSEDNFSDAGNTYYTGYLAAAKSLGIADGIGSNMFAPKQNITRQEMFTLLYNALNVMSQLPEGDSGKVLSDFTDAGQINSWAKEAMALLVESGTVGGTGSKMNPASAATRAEMAQILYNLLSK